MIVSDQGYVCHWHVIVLVIVNTHLTFTVLVQGLGDGEGGKDVSDQIENEDQMLGAKQKDVSEDQVR